MMNSLRNNPTLGKLLTLLYQRFPPLKYWGVRRGYLKRVGWIRSGWERAPVNADGDPLPWYTYPAIDFLSERVQPSMKIFEYGAGQSTHWWARLAEQVHAVEDDREWLARLSGKLPNNVDLRFASSADDSYPKSIGERGERFDVVVIDGSARNDCARECINYLTPDGVVVWDNAEQSTLFGEGLDFLATAGFRRIDFTGLGPLNMDPWTTSVLYRPGANSLGI